MLAVLHTWTQQLAFHPHVHCLVTGGGVSDDGLLWHPARKDFLVPAKALAKLVRGKLRAAFAARRPDLVLPEAAWSKPWVVHCTAWGEGEQAVLDYLARYVFRVAITNARIVGLDDQAVTIRHKHRKSNRWRTSRIPGHEFMRRFLQHVLPKGLEKVRYFGLWHPARVAGKDTWSASVASPPSRCEDHDAPPPVCSTITAWPGRAKRHRTTALRLPFVAQGAGMAPHTGRFGPACRHITHARPGCHASTLGTPRRSAARPTNVRTRPAFKPDPGLKSP